MCLCSILKKVYTCGIFGTINRFFIVQSCETQQVIMKAIVLQLSTQQKQTQNYHNMIVQRLSQSSLRSQSHKMVLLTVRKPAKIAGKYEIKDLLQNDKRTSSFFPYQYHSPKTQPNEHRLDHQASKIFKSNLRNLISKSTPYVSGQPKLSTSNKNRIQTSFGNINDKVASQQANCKQINKNRGRKPRSIVYEDSNANILKKFGYKARNKTTFYINNFMKTKHSNLRKVSLDCNSDKTSAKQQNLQKSGFFPWDRQLDSQEDVLAAS